MSKIIATIEGRAIHLNDDGSVEYDSKLAIDADGSGPNSFHDPDFQGDTTLHHNGKALNAETERYVVVPPAIIKGVGPIVMGCKAEVTYKGKTVSAVVADRGPAAKIGEGSVALAKALGIPHSPLTGGVDSGVHTKLWPGVPAVVDGVTYALQHS